MTPDLLSRVREAFEAELAKCAGSYDACCEEHHDAALAAVIAVVQEDRTREIDHLRALLRELTAHETGSCSLDHHGNCQEHGWFMDNGDEPGDCVIVRARAALGGTTHD